MGPSNEGWSALVAVVLVLVAYAVTLITVAIVLNVAAALLVRHFDR